MSSSLVPRVLAAVALVPLVVAAVLFLPTPAFAAVFGVFLLLGAREWPRLARLEGGARWTFYAALGLAVLLLVLSWERQAPWGLSLLLAIPFWLLATIWVIQAQRDVDPVGAGNMVVRVVAGCLILLPCWSAFVLLHGIDARLVLTLLVLVWVADSGAYFVGRSLGRRRLASRVSPGKSWEGVLGGLVAVGLVAWLMLREGVLVVDRPGALIALCVVVAALSVLGDLCESLFKRRAGVKDSGQLIPGHGGVLDRIDSLTIGAPAFATGWLVAGLELT